MDRTWRWTVATLAAVVGVVGAGVAGAVALTHHGRDASGRAAIAATSAELLATSTTTSPPPTTPTSRVTTTVPRPASTVTTKAEARPAISVEVTPARPKAGETVRFVVTASQPGNCCAVGLQPGDGSGEAAPSQTCTAGSGGRQRVEFTHVYNRPGTWTAVARGDAGRACDMTDAMRAAFPGGRPTASALAPVTTPALPQITTSVSVDVSPGTTTSQGPGAPAIDGMALTATPDGQVALQAVVSDADGWVARVEVDWGDGAPAAVLLPANACRNGDSGWPVGSLWVIREPVQPPVSSFVPSPSHRYATPGTHAVTVTAVSTGCDGSTPQRTTRSVSG